MKNLKSAVYTSELGVVSTATDVITVGGFIADEDVHSYWHMVGTNQKNEKVLLLQTSKSNRIKQITSENLLRLYSDFLN